MRTLMTIFFFFVLFAACQSGEKTPPYLNPENLTLQEFEVRSDSAYQISMQSGNVLSIPEKAFIDANGEVVTGNMSIGFREAFTIDQMILGGLSTRSTSGELLISDGMFYLEAYDADGNRLDINPEANVSLALINGIRPDMETFVAVDSENGMVWERTAENGLAAIQNNIAKGKASFGRNCAACHSQERLDLDMTGPALGNIHKVRNRDWLIDYTRNSQQMIVNGDPLAICLWNDWGPSVMTSFEHLPDEEINQIYDWIENESRLNKFAGVGKVYDPPCITLSGFMNGTLYYRYDTLYFSNALGEVDTTSFIVDTIQIMADDYIDSPTARIMVGMISTFSFINCGMFLADVNSREVPLEITTDFNLDAITVALIIKNWNSVLQSTFSQSDKYYFGNLPNYKTVQLPLNSDFQVIVFGTKNGLDYAGFSGFKFGAEKVEVKILELGELEVNEPLIRELRIRGETFEFPNQE